MIQLSFNILLHIINDNLQKLIQSIYLHNSKEYAGEKTTITVKDYCKIFTGRKDVNQSSTNGLYKFYSCSPTPTYSNEYLYNGKAILVAGNGSFTGRTIFVNEPFDLYQRTYAITPINNNDLIYLIYAALQTDFQKQLNSKIHGSAIPYIVYSDLADFSFEINTLYNKCIAQIQNLISQISKNQLELELLYKLENAALTLLSC